MKYQTYIYGRTLNIDFREICSPHKGLPPKMVSLVKQLINTDVSSNGDINRLRYLFVRDSGQILFGVGFNHRQCLPRELQTDFSGRGLRSFVGLVIDDSEFDRLESIPVEFDFYKKIYLKYISDIWNLEDRPKNRNVIISKVSEQDSEDNWIKLDGNISFNINNAFCRFFNPAKETGILRSIKRCSSNIVIGLNVESHVLTALRRNNVNISNALCLDTQKTHDYEFIKEEIKTSESHRDLKPQQPLQVDNASVKISQESKDMPNNCLAILSTLKTKSTDTLKQEKNGVLNDKDLMSFNWGEDNLTESCQMANDDSAFGRANEDNMNICDLVQEHSSENDSSEGDNRNETIESKTPKKEYRLKLIIAGAIATFIVVALVIGRCSKNNQTNLQKSVSGDTEKTILKK